MKEGIIQGQEEGQGEGGDREEEGGTEVQGGKGRVEETGLKM